MDSTTAAHLVVAISASYCVGIFAVWCRASSSPMWLRSLTVAIPLMLMVGIDCTEALVFFAAEFMIVSLLVPYTSTAPVADLSAAANDPSTPDHFSVFSTKSLFVATMFAAILVAVSKSLMVASLELWRTSFVSGLLVGLSFVAGRYLAVGKHQLAIRALLSVATVSLAAWILSTTCGFLDDAAVLVTYWEWKLPPSDASLGRWVILLAALCLFCAITFALLQASGKRRSWARFTGTMLAMLLATPTLLLAICMLTTPDRELVYTDDDLSKHMEFRDDLKNENYSIALNELDWSNARKIQGVVEVNMDGAKPPFWAVQASSPSMWVLAAKARFETLKLYIAGRHELFANDRSEYYHALDALDWDVSYVKLRESQLSDLGRRFGWRAQLYETLLWMSRSRFPQELVEFDRYQDTLLRMLSIDFAVRKRIREPGADLDAILKEEIWRVSDPYSRDGLQPFRYIKHENDFTIYSVGFNAIDDGCAPMQSLMGHGDVVLPRQGDYGEDPLSTNAVDR